MTWNKHALKGTLWDPKRKKIHPDNQEIKDLLKQAGITQQLASEILGIPVGRLRKNLNSWYPMPEYLRQELLGIIEMKEATERTR